MRNVPAGEWYLDKLFGLLSLDVVNVVLGWERSMVHAVFVFAQWLGLGGCFSLWWYYGFMFLKNLEIEIEISK